MIKANNAWYVKQLPNQVVIESEDGNLAMFNLAPFRSVQESELQAYNGYHPSKVTSQSLPTYIYRHYGLEFIGQETTEITASELGRMGGRVKSEAKAKASANNGAKGGRKTMQQISDTQWISSCGNWAVTTDQGYPVVYKNDECIDMDKVDVPKAVQALYDRLT